MSADGNLGSRLATGRESYRDAKWSEAFEMLKSVDRVEGLEPVDLELLSTSAYMLGNVPAMRDALERAYQGYLDRDERLPAARVALQLASNIASRGKLSEASGWVERGARILEPVNEPCVERWYLLLPKALGHIIGGEMDRVVAVAAETAEIGRQFNEHYRDGNGRHFKTR